MNMPIEDPDLIPPEPMADAEARRLAHRISGGRWTIRRMGAACLVCRRIGRVVRGQGHGKGTRSIEQIGTGPTWERAFDAALVNHGR